MDDVVAVHDEVLAATGGERGVRSIGAIEAAIDRARWGPFEGDGSIEERAAFLVRGIIQDHPFVDGNKRTGIEGTDLFLGKNGARLRASTSALVAFVIEVARGRLTIHSITRWIRAHLENA